MKGVIHYTPNKNRHTNANSALPKYKLRWQEGRERHHVMGADTAQPSPPYTQPGPRTTAGCTRLRPAECIRLYNTSANEAHWRHGKDTERTQAIRPRLATPIR